MNALVFVAEVTPGFVTVTLRVVVCVLAETAKLARISVLVTDRTVTVTPPPLTVSRHCGVKPVPLTVTVVVWPRRPSGGVTVLIVNSVEGGGVTGPRFPEQGQLDRLHLTLAPVLIGEGRRGLRWPARRTMAECLRLQSGARAVALGDDVLWDFALRRGGAQ